MQSLSLLLSVLDNFHSNPTAILLPASRATFIISNSKLSEEGPKRSVTKTEPAVLLILLAKDNRCLIRDSEPGNCYCLVPVVLIVA